MKRFIAGLVLGLTLAALPLRADYGDRYFFEKMVFALERIAIALERSNSGPSRPGVVCRNGAGAVIPCVEKP